MAAYKDRAQRSGGCKDRQSDARYAVTASPAPPGFFEQGLSRSMVDPFKWLPRRWTFVQSGHGCRPARGGDASREAFNNGDDRVTGLL